MYSIKTLSIKELKAYSKCAQLYSITRSRVHFAVECAKRIVRKQGDINFLVPSDSSIWKEDIIGGTLLHIAQSSGSCEILEELLYIGADFTIKNKHGDTILHCAYKLYYPRSDTGNDFFEYLFRDQNHTSINSILAAHIKFANSSNPCDANGFSHFHIACIVNNTKAVEFFLDNKIDINQIVNKEARQYPGFAPIHCAASNCSAQTIEVLLKYGANRAMKNGCGMTPLHQLLNQKLEILASKIKLATLEEIRNNLKGRVKLIDEAIFALLGNNFFDKMQIFDSTGLSSFHVACTMLNHSKVESLLERVEDINHCISAESPVWQGYTALHFAALCNNVEVMEIIHRRGASMDVKNAEGRTPLDICVKNGHLEDIRAAISLKPELANMLFSDNKTSLSNLLSAMRDPTELRDFLQNCVDDINMTLPNSSPLWPGCSPLHLAVAMSNKYLNSIIPVPYLRQESNFIQIKEILNNGADVTWKDASGRTPLHHAFRGNKILVCGLLGTNHHSSAHPVDEDNLSHLHIACARSSQCLVKKLLSSNDIDVNIRYGGEKTVQNIEPGSTPLDCLNIDYNMNQEIKQMLEERGAIGFRYGANSLHSACDKGDEKAVRRLLELGANVNSTLDDGRTPLHLAINRDFPKVVELLLQNGADLVAKDNDGRTPLSRLLDEESLKNVISWQNFHLYRHSMILVLGKHEELQRRMKTETGITMLHIECYMLDVDGVRYKLEQGTEDVNARVHEDSKVWPGCTPLHVLMIRVKNETFENDLNYARIINKLLLENGSDVTVANTNNDTPIHICYSCKDNYVHAIEAMRATSLLEHQRDFRINPINSKGISHFHLAVMLDNVEVAEKFLEHGVNVNQPLDLFTVSFDEYYPLHMAINNSETQMVDLLLSHGADVNLEDARGRSAVHKTLGACSPLRLELMEKLLRLGADINSQDIYGCTPLETLLGSGKLRREETVEDMQFLRSDEFCEGATAEDIRFFLQRGCRVNVYNPVSDGGYLGAALLQDDDENRKLLFENLIKAPDVATINEMGRTIIHNVVAVSCPKSSSDEYVGLFNRFKAFGCDVDDQDHVGRTALHLAALFGNRKAISALLNVGADLNIIDLHGKSALSYTLEFCVKCQENPVREHRHIDAIKALIVQILKLKFFDLYVSQLNDDLVGVSFEIMNRKIDSNLSAYFYSELKIAKNFTIEELPLTLGDFLSETNAVVKYSRMSELSRDVIDKVFESIGTQFKRILPLLKLQHRKAVTRFRLVETISSMEDLIGFPLPALCADNILRFLSIADLKNVVAAIKFEV